MVSANDNGANDIGSKKILVLYGSQTGNSEQAALDFVRAIGNEVPASVLQLDDFLDLQHQAPHELVFVGVVVLIVSSYGVGGAPLGAQRFRQVCDYWLDQQSYSDPQPLEGLQYAMCGLGDSKFGTFLENPTRIDKALQHVGARRIGNLGIADASGDQEAAILDWRQSVLEQVQTRAATCTVTDERLKKMQDFTLSGFVKILPRTSQAKKGEYSKGMVRKPSYRDTTMMMLLSACLVALLACFVALFGRDFLWSSVGNVFRL